MHSHDDELLVLAEALGEVKTKTEKLEAEFSTQARPLEAATNALSATLSGIKALQFHVIDNNLGALSARVEEMRKAVDEQVGVIALELKKADESNAAKAGQEADALRSEIAGLQAQLGTLGAQFEAQLARVEFAAKEEAKKLQLIPGPAGEAGASLNPRGTFIDGQTYNRLDVVSWLGSSYIATVDGVTEKPSKTSTQWQVLASRGNGGGGTASLNDMLGAPSAGTIVGSEGSSYVRKTLVAGANIAISETPSTITITGTEGEISLEDGSAASPSLFFTNDPDTGIYRPGSNQVGISLGGSAQAVLTSTTFTVTPNLVVSGTGTSSIGGNATVAGTLRVATKVIDTSGGYLYGGSSNDPGTIGAFGDLSGNAILTISRATGNDATLGAGFGNLNLAAVSNVKTGNVFQVTNTTASSSTSSGALVVSGGVGVAGAIYAGGKVVVNGGDAGAAQFAVASASGTLVANLTAGSTTNQSFGLRMFAGTSASDYGLFLRNVTDTTTLFKVDGVGGTTVGGTLTVSAGSLVVDHVGSSSPTLSLSANGSVQSRFFANGSNTFLESYTSTPLILRTNQTTALTITTGQQVQVNATTASTSTSSGALVVSGGLGVAGNLNIGGELQISSAYPAFKLTDTNSNSDFTILNDNGRLAVYDETNAAYRLTIGATGGVKIGTTPEDVGANNLTVQGTLAVNGSGSVFATRIFINSASNNQLLGDGSGFNGLTTSSLGLRNDQGNIVLAASGSIAQFTLSSTTLSLSSTTASTSTSTGALVVSGGVGVAKEVYIGKTCKVGTGSDNEGYTNVFTNKAENTAGPFDITLPSDCVGVVFLNSHQGGVGRSFREIPFICFGGTVTLGTSRTTVLTADPVTSVAAAASSKITISLYAANTNCYWGIYVNKS